MPTLPRPAHGDTLPVAQIREKKEGRGDARHTVGAELKVLLPFDSYAPVPITIRGLDVQTLPSPEVVTERNMKIDFLMARFTDLTISFTGGDFGAVRYTGTASGVEFLNLTPAAPGAPSAPGVVKKE